MQRYTIEIVPYDPDWPAAYECERRRIEPALSEHVLRYEHMGSTSVPGLEAKPIIDLMAAVRSLDDVEGLHGILDSLGYVPDKRAAIDRRDFWHMTDRDRPEHILHFMEDGSDAWIRPLVFRDALREDGNLRERYAAFKRRLAEEAIDDIEEYGRRKGELICPVVNAALNLPNDEAQPGMWKSGK